MWLNIVYMFCFGTWICCCLLEPNRTTVYPHINHINQNRTTTIIRNIPTNEPECKHRQHATCIWVKAAVQSVYKNHKTQGVGGGGGGGNKNLSLFLCGPYSEGHFQTDHKYTSLTREGLPKGIYSKHSAIALTSKLLLNIL